jgi:hypothetical protein
VGLGGGVGGGVEGEGGAGRMVNGHWSCGEYFDAP